ncbi:MAG: anti-sigma factor family protein [Chloroflexota bacterium]
MQPSDHIADEILSASLDHQLEPEQAHEAAAHLESCLVCVGRLDELRMMVGLLRGLPSLELPRDFALGPRLVADPPNLVRLRRWYGVARTGAATLVAAFVLVSVGSLYVDSRPEATTAGLSAQFQLGAAPAVPAAASAQVRAVAPPAPAPAARGPALSTDSASASSGVAGAGAAAPARTLGPTAAAVEEVRTAPTPGEDLGDQVSAATSVRALPTLAPTPGPIPTRTPFQIPRQPVASAVSPSAAPLRTGAAIIGALALLALTATLLIRRRLRATSIAFTE